MTPNNGWMKSWSSLKKPTERWSDKFMRKMEKCPVCLNLFTVTEKNSAICEPCLAEYCNRLTPEVSEE